MLIKNFFLNCLSYFYNNTGGGHHHLSGSECLKPFVIHAFIISLILVPTACSQKQKTATEPVLYPELLIDDQALLETDKNPGNWLSYGRNYEETRFSPLQQITRSNVDSLGLAWSINLGTTRGLETTPLVVDGILYLTGAWSIVYAIDARKGKILWMFDPQVPGEYAEKGCCGVVNRGLAIYKGMLFLGAFDGRLIAINASTGKKIWDVLTVDQKKAYTITGAPRVINGKVIIGNGGAEYGVRGYITAYDAVTGKQIWRFYTVPGNPDDGFESEAMEAAAKTWTGEWWKFGGGGTA